MGNNQRRSEMDRDEFIKTIKANLQKRSGKVWSVTGGKGTAWGWVKITAPPARCTWGHRPKEGMGECPPPGKEYWDAYDTGKPGRDMSPGDKAELARLLGLDRVSEQGKKVPPQNDYWAEYLDRAAGRTPTRTGTPEWD